MSTTARQGRSTVAWGSWNGGTAETARRKRRRRGETLRRLESLEDRRLLNASISVDSDLVLQYDGDAVVAENVAVTQTGTTFRFTSNNDIDLPATTPAGVTVEYPLLGNNKIVDVTGITAMNLVMHSAGSTADVPTPTIPADVYDSVPEPSYTYSYSGAASDGVLVSDGGNSTLTGGFQTLMISSQGDTPQFANLHLANKGNLFIHQNASADGYAITVDYASTTAVAGLNNAQITQGVGNDTAALTSLAPGAAWGLVQGTGDDTADLTLAGTAGTTSTTLDGGPGINLLTIDAGGAAISGANFFTNPDGSVTIQGAPLPGGPITYANYEGVTVNDAGLALTPTVTATPINGVEGQALVNVLVGSFTSSAPATAADFVATIDWNTDAGAPTSGTVVQDANDPSIFHVYGDHTYYAPGAAIPTNVTVRSLAKTTEQLIGNTHVAFVRPASDPTAAGASSTSTATINNAPLNVSVNGFHGIENTPIASGDVVVATFTDLAGIDPSLADPTSVYTATVDWGDGSTAVGAISIVQNGTSAQYIVSAGAHTYAVPGSYPVTVNVAKTNGLLPPTVVKTGVGSNFAVVADAPLTAVDPQPTIAAAVEGTRIVDAVIGAFTDANPNATADEYQITVDWGDGTGSQLARARRVPGGNVFEVVGSHTYASAIPAGGAPIVSGAGPFAAVSPVGTYPVTIAVKDTYGSAVNLFNTATVDPRFLAVIGGMDSRSDTGISNSDGVTNDATPTFNGWTSQGDAQVYVYASKDGAAATFLGSTTADATGAWSFTPIGALADGGYVVQVQAYDAGGHSVSALATVSSNLVVDTVGPKVTDVLFDNVHGRVIASFQDFGGVGDVGVGVVGTTMRDANNYRFLQPNQSLRRWRATGIDVTPGTDVGEQTATILINGGRGIRGGKYAFTIRSVDPTNLSGIQDVAGNALDGEFYGFLPSGNNVNGGDFAANLDAIHHTIFPARSQVGAASPVSPPGRLATGAKIGPGGRLLFPGGGPAAQALAARPALLARPQLAARALRTR